MIEFYRQMTYMLSSCCCHMLLVASECCTELQRCPYLQNGLLLRSRGQASERQSSLRRNRGKECVAVCETGFARTGLYKCESSRRDLMFDLNIDTYTLQVCPVADLFAHWRSGTGLGWQLIETAEKLTFLNRCPVMIWLDMPGKRGAPQLLDLGRSGQTEPFAQHVGFAVGGCPQFMSQQYPFFK